MPSAEATQWIQRRVETPVANGSGPAYSAPAVLGVLNNGTNPDLVTNRTGNVFVLQKLTDELPIPRTDPLMGVSGNSGCGVDASGNWWQHGN